MRSMVERGLRRLKLILDSAGAQALSPSLIPLRSMGEDGASIVSPKISFSSRTPRKGCFPSE